MAASATPGSSIAVNTPPVLSPSAGMCPPRPGRYRIASATRIPATASTGSGHHVGGVEKPRPCGRSVNTQPCRSATRARNQYATAEMGMPISAASTRIAT
jgi:hypothetical protein